MAKAHQKVMLLNKNNITTIFGITSPVNQKLNRRNVVVYLNTSSYHAPSLLAKTCYHPNRSIVSGKATGETVADVFKREACAAGR